MMVFIVFYEPTDLEVCTRPFETKKWKAINFITPNLNELKQIAAHFGIKASENLSTIEEVVFLVHKVTDYVDNVIVTMGADGVIVARKGKATESFLAPKQGKLEIRQYIADGTKPVVSVNGAGDNLASGIIAATLSGLSEEESLAVGLLAAEYAIAVSGPVPEKLFERSHKVWKSKAKYKTLC